jgi:hypothetical protein
MEDFIKRLAADEGWTPTTTAIVLTGVLQQLVDMGAADPEDLKAMVRSRGGVDAAPDGPPEIGERIGMTGVDTVIEVEEIPDEQPEASEGVYAIVDQYGETHRVEHDGGNGWVVLIPAI